MTEREKLITDVPNTYLNTKKEHFHIVYKIKVAEVIYENMNYSTPKKKKNNEIIASPSTPIIYQNQQYREVQIMILIPCHKYGYTYNCLSLVRLVNISPSWLLSLLCARFLHT